MQVVLWSFFFLLLGSKFQGKLRIKINFQNFFYKLILTLFPLELLNNFVLPVIFLSWMSSWSAHDFGANDN